MIEIYLLPLLLLRLLLLLLLLLLHTGVALQR
jgi:hypothetical protein